MDYPDIPIHITSAPTDWPTVCAAFAAAFLGAGSAFMLNIFLNRLRERQGRLHAINTAVYGILMSVTTLVNLKEQFLTKFNDEFDQLQELIKAVDLSAPEEELKCAAQVIAVSMNAIGPEEERLNGALIPWQEVDFPLMPDAVVFNFTVSGNPDIVRLIHVAKIEMTGVEKLISSRNVYWDKNIDATIEGTNDAASTRKWLTTIFQMLSLRKVLREHVDIALVVAQTALDQLEDYRKKHLKKRAWYSSWFFRIFVDKENWTTYKQSARISRAIPDKAAYKTILDLTDQG
jgi:hypothetical protein